MTDEQYKKIMEKLNSISHDLQQVKTSQRASQKRERELAEGKPESPDSPPYY